MQTGKSALILIGYQNDYFSPTGILAGALETPGRVRDILDRTVRLIKGLESSDVSIIHTPILFTPGYAELRDPVGILKLIRDVGAFRRDSEGGATVDELLQFGPRILEVPGKRGLNAFSNTELDSELRARGIRQVVLAGVVTSICIDSTARAAAERGYAVSVLSDCTGGRTALEQDFYCREVFPLYARVITSDDLLKELSGWLAPSTTT